MSCTSLSEADLREETSKMNYPASPEAVQSLLQHMHFTMPSCSEDRNLYTTCINFLERSIDPVGKDSCLNLHIHVIVYLLNGKQLLIGGSVSDAVVVNDSLVGDTDEDHLVEGTAPGTTVDIVKLDEADLFLEEMKQLGL
jgi:hypothetical protein